jgi:Phage derived protein Gp49-like (DUF891)
MTWNLAFYQTPRGERPAAAFVEQLPEPARAEVAALLAALRERGNLLRPPHSKALGDGLFELRSVTHARSHLLHVPSGPADRAAGRDCEEARRHSGGGSSAHPTAAE